MGLLNVFRALIGTKRGLTSALERTIQLLEESEDSDWSSLSAQEIKEILEGELTKIN